MFVTEAQLQAVAWEVGCAVIALILIAVSMYNPPKKKSGTLGPRRKEDDKK